MYRLTPFLKSAAVLALPTLAVFASPSRVDAAVIYGLADNKIIFRIDSERPEYIQSAVQMLPLRDAAALAVDEMPSEPGTVYVLTNDRKIIGLNPDTGFLRGSSFDLRNPYPNGTSFGFDAEPTTGRLRTISDTRQNRLTTVPPFGFADETITQLSSSTANIVGLAYSNNYPGATTSTLYGIDSLTDQLVTINPDTGLVAPVADLTVGGQHIDITNRVGFDIAWEVDGDVAYAAVNETPTSVSDLYRIDLATGQMEFLGQIGGGLFVHGIAIAIPEPTTLTLLAATTLLLPRRRH